MLIPNWSVPNNIHAMTLCRDDDLNKIKLPKNIGWLNQTHSNICSQLNSILFNNYLNITADASYTNEPLTACAVKTADCLPILLCSTDGQWLAAIHAGWRGLAAGIIENTIVNYTGNKTDIIAWFGPAISKKHFVVGQEVYKIFTDNDVNSQQAFIKSEIEENKYYADLYQLAKIRLNKLGTTKIYFDNYCTFSDPEKFYSYRKDNSEIRRLITLIWRDPISNND
jgi:YfiH family protein